MICCLRSSQQAHIAHHDKKEKMWDGKKEGKKKEKCASVSHLAEKRHKAEKKVTFGETPLPVKNTGRDPDGQADSRRWLGFDNLRRRRLF